ncbi:hypothetical protein LCGC14_1699690, partial [marine sediment metagenome]
ELRKMKDGLSPHSFKEISKNDRHCELDLEDVKNSLKSLMWRNVGIERDDKHLKEVVENIDLWCKYIINNEFSTPLGWEVQNMLTVARLISISASKRKESRGVHYRLDFPDNNDKCWKKHIVISNGKYTIIP